MIFNLYGGFWALIVGCTHRIVITRFYQRIVRVGEGFCRDAAQVLEGIAVVPGSGCGV